MSDVTVINPFYSLLIVAIIAFFIPLLTKRLGVPVIVGEIGFGILVGILNVVIRDNFDVVIISFEHGSGLDFLAEIGLIFLLFLAGLEIDINIIEERGIRAVLFGVIMFMFAFILSMVFMWLLDMGVYMALILSTTSVGVVIPILREMGISKTPLGQDIILAAIVADFATMMMIPLFKLIETDPTASVFDYAWFVIIILIVFGAFFAIFLLGGIAMWKWPHDMAKFFKADDPTEMGVRASFLIIMGFVALSVAFHMDVILGAFLAGTAMNFIFRETALLERKLYGLGYGFFIPIFFIQIGVEFTDLVELSGLALVPVLVVMAFVIKMVPGMMFVKAHGVRNSLASGILLSARLSLLIAAIKIGIDAGIQEVIDMAAPLILLALIMCVAAPIGFRYLYVPPPEMEEPKEVEPIYEMMEQEDPSKWRAW
ncbi:MAG: cation:proton antiporter [Thermoplasmata archaeon]|nr:MAG: cation:proton antiporter [Thermoplasmata archaeon]